MQPCAPLSSTAPGESLWAFPAPCPALPCPGCSEMAPLALPSPSLPELPTQRQPYFSWLWPAPPADTQGGARGRGRPGPGMHKEIWEVLLQGWGRGRGGVGKQAGAAVVRSGLRRDEGGLNCNLPPHTIWTPDAELRAALSQSLFPGARQPTLLCLKDPPRGSFISKGELHPPLAITPRLN